MANIYNLRNTSNTEREDEKTRTERDDKTTVRQETTVSPFLNDDGTVNQAAVDDFNRTRVQPIQDKHGIDPTTGKVSDKTLFGVLGINPADTRKQREKEQKLNRWKQIESALYHSGALLSDMISAGVGGNVWKRDKDQTAAKAHEANLKLQAEQNAEDAAVAAARDKLNKDYLADIMKAREAYEKTFGRKFSQSTESGGGSTTTKTGGNTHTTGTRQVVVKDNNGNGSGSGSSKTTKIVNIRVKDKNGNTTTEPFEIPANQFDTMGRYLSEVYSNLTNEGKRNVDALLAQHNIFPRDTGTGKNTYDGADLLASGIVFDDPQIRSEFVRIVQNDSSRTDEEKKAILQAMIEYPTNATAEKKRSWWQRVKDWFKSDNNQDEDEGYNPDAATSTEGGL